MKEKNNNKLIIVLVIVVALLAGALVLEYLSKPNNKYIVLDDFIIEYNKTGIKKANYEDAKGYSFRILYSNNYIGNYTYDHTDIELKRLYFKNEDGINIINTPILGLDKNTDLIDINIDSMNEDDFNLYKSMKEGNTNYKLSDLTIANKAVINNNGKNITVYSVKYEGKNEEDDHSMLFASNGKSIYMLDEDYPREVTGGYEFYSFNIEYVIDLNKDNKYELIVSKSHLDVTDYSIYSLDGEFPELYYTGE